MLQGVERRGCLCWDLTPSPCCKLQVTLVAFAAIALLVGFLGHVDVIHGLHMCKGHVSELMMAFSGSVLLFASLHGCANVKAADDNTEETPHSKQRRTETPMVAPVARRFPAGGNPLTSRRPLVTLPTTIDSSSPGLPQQPTLLSLNHSQGHVLVKWWPGVSVEANLKEFAEKAAAKYGLTSGDQYIATKDTLNSIIYIKNHDKDVGHIEYAIQYGRAVGLNDETLFELIDKHRASKTKS